MSDTGIFPPFFFFFFFAISNNMIVNCSRFVVFNFVKISIIIICVLQCIVITSKVSTMYLMYDNSLIKCLTRSKVLMNSKTTQSDIDEYTAIIHPLELA